MGIIMVAVNAETASLLEKRQQFVLVYCKLKGWNIHDLSFDQIFEMRKLEGWKNPK